MVFPSLTSTLVVTFVPFTTLVEVDTDEPPPVLPGLTPLVPKPAPASSPLIPPNSPRTLSILFLVEESRFPKWSAVLDFLCQVFHVDASSSVSLGRLLAEEPTGMPDVSALMSDGFYPGFLLPPVH